MKKQLLHEHHNRQEKASKPDYLEDLRATPRSPDTWQGKNSSRTGLRDFDGARTSPKLTKFSDVVAKAISQLCPAIDSEKLKTAINSDLSRHKIQFKISFKTRNVTKTAHYFSGGEMGRLLWDGSAWVVPEGLRKSISRTLPGRFYLWHEETESEACEIPREFHTWLNKFQPRKDDAQLKDATIVPAASKSPVLTSKLKMPQKVFSCPYCKQTAKRIRHHLLNCGARPSRCPYCHTSVLLGSYKTHLAKCRAYQKAQAKEREKALMESERAWKKSNGWRLNNLSTNTFLRRV